VSRRSLRQDLAVVTVFLFFAHTCWVENEMTHALLQQRRNGPAGDPCSFAAMTKWVSGLVLCTLCAFYPLGFGIQTSRRQPPPLRHQRGDGLRRLNLELCVLVVN
jgi:hypothetical protein